MNSAEATVFAAGGSKPVPMRCVLLCAAAIAGCTASREEVKPPDNKLFFPTGAAASPDGSLLFVTNANSELRFDSGSVSVFDLATIDRYAETWTMTGEIPDAATCVATDDHPCCSQDPDHRETLSCPAWGDFMRGNAAARIGNFATAIAVQDTGSGTLRLVIPTRGDPSITWLDWDGSKLFCNSGADGFALCDEAHRLSYVRNDPDVGLMPEEPFDAFADSTGQFALVTHLTTGAVTLVDSPIGADAQITDVLQGLFAPDPLTNLRGATGVAGRPSMGGDVVYVGSRSEDRIQMLTVGRPPNGAPPYIVPGNYFFLNLVGSASGGSFDTRSIRFSPSGDRMYLINRKPPSLQVYDTSLGPTGFPQNRGVGATDICRQASTLAVMDAGDGDRAYISCFQDGQLYIVDPRGLSSVEDIVLVGRGPYTVVGSAAHKKVYVTNFLEDTVAVVDVNPTSPRYNRVVLRIGEVRPAQ